MKKFSVKDFLPITFIMLFIVLQIVAGMVLQSVVSQNRTLAYIGIALYILSGTIFGMLPVFEFRRKGGVKKGTSYIHTARLVDTGIYSIVRHPQYMTWMWWSAAGMFLFQHWIVILIGIPVFPLTCIDIIKADKDALEKFGDDYREYMKKVPRMNFPAGIFRRFSRRG